ncbi:MAG: hypothetical protein J7K75_04375 [Desulfuromonas sp.]|nr:hypothetical protein [Desulfuromonas sp.]
MLISVADVAQAQSIDDLRQSVVKIYSQYNRCNYHEPWQKYGQRLISGTGTGSATFSP